MNQHIGSNFDDFLEEEGLLEEITAIAQERVLAWPGPTNQALDTPPLKD